MKRFFLTLGLATVFVGLSSLFPTTASFTQTYSHQIIATSNELSYVWQQSKTITFNELIVSWNAQRPQAGKYTLLVRVKGKKWSNWIKYAEWGARKQQSFSCSKDAIAQLEVGRISIKNNSYASAFDVKVEASGGANLTEAHHFYACVSNLSKYENIKPSRNLLSGEIEDFPLQSQMVLNHLRARDLCSPTSTSSVLSFLLKGFVDPVDFAALAHDDACDIYGNWVLNVAAAYDISGGKIPCCVQRLASFDVLHSYLLEDCPVVVSIQGPLRGGALPYAKGHLMVVIGWDAQNRRVLCRDSAFKSNNETKVWYDIDDFRRAWGRRKNLSYVFMPLS